MVEMIQNCDKSTLFSQIRKFLSPDLFLSSDHHFFHKNIVKYEPKRDKLQREKNKSIEQIMIERWVEKVPKDAHLLYLGDFSFSNEPDFEKTLTGKRILLKGNHDCFSTEKYVEWGFLDVIKNQIAILDDNIEVINKNYEYKAPCIIADVSNIRIMFSHIPILLKKRREKRYGRNSAFLNELFDEFDCDINIHGHLHTDFTGMSNCFNIGVDVLDYTPIQLKNILFMYRLKRKR